MASPTSPSSRVPSRSLTATTDDDLQPGEDTSEVTRLFNERLQAWKHACGYLEDYVKSTEKMQQAHGKEYEKVLKTVNSPLREGEHFDHNPGGVASLFDQIRTSTQAISNAHTQTASALKGSVLPIFERLHNEIKNKQKELAKGVGKGAKAVDKARAESQKYIDLLGTHTSSHETLGAKDASNDPYVLQRGVHHRLNKQFQEENSNRQDMITVQNNFAQFESHVVQVFQQGIGLFASTVGNQAEQQKTLYGQMAETGQAIDPSHEWTGFVQRKSDFLIDPNAPPKSLANATFANQNHASTQPMCQGALERKQGIMRKFETSSYAVTPARFLHEFKSTDDVSKDPSADLSLFLPDCTVGNLNGNLFTIKGKDVSKGKLGAAISTSKEYEFRTTSSHDAETWYGIISAMAGLKPGDTMSPTLSPNSPTSPTASLATREQGLGQSMTSPTSPTSPTTRHESSTVGAGEGVATGDAAANAPTTAATAHPGTAS